MTPIRALLLTVVIAVALIVLVFIGTLPGVFGLIAIAAVLAMTFWLLRAHLPSILLVFVSVLLVCVIATRQRPKWKPDRLLAEEGDRLSQKWQASGRFNEKLPIVVHLIFDELMSTGAMTADLPGAAQTRRSLLEFGERHSFRVFDSVYSRYWYTGESIPHLMNREYLGHTGMDTFFHPPVDEKARTYHIRDNAYFDDLAARGYRTVVFQNSYMDFCANRNVDLCETFDSFDPTRNTAGVDSPSMRVSLWRTVFRAYAPSYTSELGEKILGRIYSLDKTTDGIEGFNGERFDVHRFPQWFDRFTRFTAGVPRGTHVFAHFLVPHSPYLLLESCVLSGKIEQGYFLSQYPAAERPSKRDYFYERYFSQVRCVRNALESFMTAIEQSENFKDAVIIIHGDHGARISTGDVLEDYTPRDFVDNYAAFFAVRAPNVASGVDCEFVSLADIFHRQMVRDTKKRSGPPLPVVVLSRRAGDAKVEAPMPLFGCAAAEASVPR